VSRGRSVATIYRDLQGLSALSATLYGELADRAESAEGTFAIPRERGATKKRERKARVIERPAGQNDELAQARARRIMRATGFTEGNK
jgi:hypothetical protein